MLAVNVAERQWIVSTGRSLELGTLHGFVKETPFCIVTHYAGLFSEPKQLQEFPKQSMQLRGTV
jgi:hypothetical protein